MLERNIAEKVLTVGCDFRKPKGGIAQLIYNYSRFVFPEFNYVKTGKGKRTIGSYWLAVLSPFKLAFKILLNRKIEIIHIHTASYKAFKKACFYMNLAKALGKKTVLHIHGGGFKDYYESDKEYVSSQLKKADAIIALSQSWKNFLMK